MTEDPAPTWCAGTAAAHQLGVNYHTLRRWVKQDGAPHRVRGNGFQVNVAEVQRWREQTGRLHDTGGTSSAAQRAQRATNPAKAARPAKGKGAKPAMAKRGAKLDPDQPMLCENCSGELSPGDVSRLLSEAKLRKERALAGKAELDEAQKRGELLAKADGRAVISRMAGAIKSAALAVPGRVGPQLATMTTRDAELALEREMRGLLSAMASAVEAM